MAAAVAPSGVPSRTHANRSSAATTSSDSHRDKKNASAAMYRTTSTPLPTNLEQLPSNFIDHLVLITQSLVDSNPPPTISKGQPQLYGSSGSGSGSGSTTGGGGHYAQSAYSFGHSSSSAATQRKAGWRVEDLADTLVGLANSTRSAAAASSAASKAAANATKEGKEEEQQGEEDDEEGSHSHQGGGSGSAEEVGSTYTATGSTTGSNGSAEPGNKAEGYPSSSKTAETTPATSPFGGPDKVSSSATTSTTHSSTGAAAQREEDIDPLASLGPNEGVLSLPLPRFHFEGGDERTQVIENNLNKLVERLWKAEDQLENIAIVASRRMSAQEKEGEEGAEQQPHEGAIPIKASPSTTGGGDSSNPSNAAPCPNCGAIKGARGGPHGMASGLSSSSFKDFPYPVSHAPPQSSTYPLSYPLGMSQDGTPILLAAAGTGPDGQSGMSPEAAVGAFERYSDESGLSAQEELRLLKAQVQDIARVCKAVAFGDLSQHITVPVQGHVMVELKDIINQMVDTLSNFAADVTRVSLEVGTEGKLGGQVEVGGVEGRWKELKNVVNKLAMNLTNQVRGVATVTKVSTSILRTGLDIEF